MLDKHFKAIVAACLVAIAAVLVLPVLWRYVPSQYEIDATFKSIGDGFKKVAREREIERCAIKFRHMVRGDNESDPECKKLMFRWEDEEKCRARNLKWEECGRRCKGCCGPASGPPDGLGAA